MTIIDIAREIELKEKKTVEQKSTDKTDWKPTECTDYILPQLNIPVIRSKVCVQRTLGKVLAFIDMVKYYRDYNVYNCMMGAVGLLFIDFLIFIFFEQFHSMYQKMIENQQIQYEMENKES